MPKLRPGRRTRDARGLRRHVPRHAPGQGVDRGARGDLRGRQERAVLQMRTGLALGLLGEGSVVDELLAESMLEGPRLRESTRTPPSARRGRGGTGRGDLGPRVHRRQARARRSSAASRWTTTTVPSGGSRVRGGGPRPAGRPLPAAVAPWMLTLGANYRARTATLTTGERTGVLDLESRLTCWRPLAGMFSSRALGSRAPPSACARAKPEPLSMHWTHLPLDRLLDTPSRISA